jgi:hypothetical protein
MWGKTTTSRKGNSGKSSTDSEGMTSDDIGVPRYDSPYYVGTKLKGFNTMTVQAVT